MLIVLVQVALRSLRSPAFASVLGLCWTLIASPSLAQPVVSFDQALRLAQDRSRQLAAQGYAASAARDMAIAAAQLPDPTLTAGVNNLPVTGPDQFSLTRDFMTMRSIGVMQQFTRRDKREARAARFEREAEAAQAGRALTLANLQRDTALAWFDRYYQERLRDALTKQLDEARLQIEAADSAYRGGRGSQADVFSARATAAQIEDRVAQANREIAIANSKLARWIGNAANQPLGAAPNTDVLSVDWTRLEDHVTYHPEIVVMQQQEQIARAEAEIAQANKRSDWSAEFMYSQRGPAYSNMISVNVSIPLQIDRADRQDRELAAKLAVIDQLQAQREEGTREHVADVRSWLLQWQSARDRLRHYDASIVPLSAGRTGAALAAYRGGGSLNAVLEARRMEIETNLEQVRLAMEVATAWTQLEYLIPANGGLK